MMALSPCLCILEKNLMRAIEVFSRGVRSANSAEAALVVSAWAAWAGVTRLRTEASQHRTVGCQSVSRMSGSTCAWCSNEG
eukprot:6956148-Lingulodinium_polyedra.AAC.1